MAEKNFVAEINEVLDDFGEDAIVEDKGSPFGGVGYSWQYLCDAVNDVLGPDGWSYDLLDLTVAEKGKSFYAEARIQLYVNLTGLRGALDKGPDRGAKGVTVGSCQNIGRGDAQKGAITDALKKGFSLFSIGNKAMRGDLGNNKKKSKPPAKGKNPPKAPPAKDTKGEVGQKDDLIREILTASKDLGLSDERRDSLKKKHTGGKDLNEASLDELDKLYIVLVDMQNETAAKS
jgi:recombination DNA repair RAD52 pathway protein